MKKAKEKLRAAPYLRVSDNKQVEEGHSLENQEGWIRNHIEMKGWSGLTPYRDEGKTAGNINRPGLNRLRHDIRSGLIDVVVIYKLDRLSRRLRDFLMLLAEMEEHDVKLVSLSESIDTSTPAGRVVVNILMAFAQFELETISQRIKEAKDAGKKRGEWVGGKPAYGLKYIKKKGLVPHGTKAAHIRELFRSYLRLQSTTEVAQHLRELFPSGRKWTPSNVAGALRNGFYAGQVRVGPDEWVDGKHEPIVDAETFAKAGEILEANRLKCRAQTKEYKHGIAVVELLECSCGSKCSVKHSYNRSRKQNGKRYDRIICKRARKKKGDCPNSVEPVLGLKLQQACVDIVAKAARDPRVIKAALQELQKLRQGELEDAQIQVEQYQAELKELNKQIRRLIKAAKETDSTSISREIQELEDTKASLEQRIRDLKAIQPSPAPSPYHLKRIRKALEEFTGLYEVMTFAEKRELFQAFFRKIIWHGTHAELVFAGGQRRIMPLIDGKFSTEDLLDSIPADMRLRTRRMEPAKECQVVDCTKPRHSGGLCRMHYKRTRATGKPRAKLTEEQVQEIRDLKKANTKLSTRKLGKQFGVSHTAVAKVLQGKTWK